MKITVPVEFEFTRRPDGGMTKIHLKMEGFTARVMADSVERGYVAGTAGGGVEVHVGHDDADYVMLYAPPAAVWDAVVEALRTAGYRIADLVPTFRVSEAEPEGGKQS